MCPYHLHGDSEATTKNQALPTCSCFVHASCQKMLYNPSQDLSFGCIPESDAGHALHCSSDDPTFFFQCRAEVDG